MPHMALRFPGCGCPSDDGHICLFQCQIRFPHTPPAHGFRVELDEVRASLEKSPLIKQAVAVPKYNKDGKVTHLIADVIPKEQPDDPAALTKAIRESLDGLIMPYMMPTQFIYRESFPMSANGKIAVKQLISEANK